MQHRITQFVTQHSGISAQRFHDLAMNTEELVMDIGTVLNGEQAVEEGLIDSLGTLSQAIDCLQGMIDQRRQENPQAGAKKTKTTAKKSSPKGKKPKG